MKFEGLFNRSVKSMFGLPHATHRYFMEPVSRMEHPKTTLMRRYLSFIDQIKKSPKCALKKILKVATKDVRSVTGSNLRYIMLELEKTSTSDLTMNDVTNLIYSYIPDNEVYRINLVNELIEAKACNLEIQGFKNNEIDIFLDYLCTS